MKVTLSVLFMGLALCALSVSLLADDQASPKKEEAAELAACAQSAAGGFLKIADTRDQRFPGGSRQRHCCLIKHKVPLES